MMEEERYSKKWDRMLNDLLDKYDFTDLDTEFNLAKIGGRIICFCISETDPAMSVFRPIYINNMGSSRVLRLSASKETNIRAHKKLMKIRPSESSLKMKDLEDLKKWAEG